MSSNYLALLVFCVNNEAKQLEESRELNEKAAEIFIRNDHPDSLEHALDLLNQALAAYPKSRAAFSNKVQVLIKLDRSLEAVSELRAFLNRNPDSAVMADYLGLLYDKLDQPDSADHYYKQALQQYETQLKTDSTDLILANKYLLTVFIDSTKRGSILVEIDSLLELYPDNQTFQATRNEVAEVSRQEHVRGIFQMDDDTP